MSDHPGGQFPPPGQQLPWQTPPAQPPYQQGPEKQAVSLEVGDCVRVTGAGETADAVKTPCDAPATPYVVGITGIDKGTWDCQQGFYRLAVDAKREENVALCLGLNGQVGACFDDLESKTPPPLVDCSTARLKVIQVLPSSSIVGDGCGEKAEKVVSYTSYGGASRFKDSTICLAAP
jgi:hypothetical protein